MKNCYGIHPVAIIPILRRQWPVQSVFPAQHLRYLRQVIYAQQHVCVAHKLDVAAVRRRLEAVVFYQEVNGQVPVDEVLPVGLVLHEQVKRRILFQHPERAAVDEEARVLGPDAAAYAAHGEEEVHVQDSVLCAERQAQLAPVVQFPTYLDWISPTSRTMRNH